ncbi:winged helix-turn-helix domain-containing protein [Armatimonas sp.]|uniref:winged helix-turn-helix domain-containing protein n=1 Tax=Armatimonas sp. TaxID=1872638 RepID=UPI003752F072
MQNVLILTRDAPERPPLQVTHALMAASLHVCPLPFDADEGEWIGAFNGVPPHLIVADLSDSSDLFLLRSARSRLLAIWGEGVPIPPLLALLTRRHLASPELRAFVDDFLLPPYEPEEVKARVALLFFRKRSVEAGDMLHFGGIRLSLGAGKVSTAEGKPLALTPREFQLLRFLLTHRGRRYPREQILAMVWGVDYEGGERTVDIHIRRLRAKLPPETAALLETRRGLGYGFRVE